MNSTNDSDFTVGDITIDVGSDDYTTINVSDLNYDWLNDSTFTITDIDSAASKINTHKIQVNSGQGEWDLEDRLRVIERALNIPARNYELEKQYPELSKLFDDHMQKIESALKQIPVESRYQQEIEKYQMWKKLNE